LHDLLLLVLDEALLFLDLPGDAGACFSNFAASCFIGLLLGNLLVELDAATPFQIQTIYVFQLLLLPSVILLRL